MSDETQSGWSRYLPEQPNMANVNHQTCNCHECTQARWKCSLQRQLEAALLRNPLVSTREERLEAALRLVSGQLEYIEGYVEGMAETWDDAPHLKPTFEFLMRDVKEFRETLRAALLSEGERTKGQKA